MRLTSNMRAGGFHLEIQVIAKPPAHNTAVSLSEALEEAPDKHGCYVLFIDPVGFEQLSAGLPKLREYYDPTTQVLYVGEAWRQTLKQRISRNHATSNPGNSSPSKSLHALLGEGARQRNKAEPTRLAVHEWFSKHVTLAWRAVPKEGNASCLERQWIRCLKPPLNLNKGDHLPQCIRREMTQLRKRVDEPRPEG